MLDMLVQRGCCFVPLPGQYHRLPCPSQIVKCSCLHLQYFPDLLSLDLGYLYACLQLLRASPRRLTSYFWLIFHTYLVSLFPGSSQIYCVVSLFSTA